ncbi:MAG: hypothetical protein ACLGIC_11200 [Acidimicrobiia bacterium]
MPSDLLLITAGAVVVVAVLYDVAATTISLSAVRGPVSTRLSAAYGAVVNRLARGRLRPLLRATGPTVVVLILVGWLLTLAAGWSLIFSADGALQQTAEPEQRSSVRWSDAMFFVIRRLIGTGSSNLEPDQAGWSAALALLTLSGVLLLTLVVAWVLPVVNAVVEKRALASKLSSLGGTPEDIILRAWTGRDLGDLNLHLLLIDQLTVLAQRHLAYPVIHHFHSTAPRTFIAARLAALDEALTLVCAAGLDDVDRGTGVDVSVTRPLRQSISDYLSTLEHTFVRPADEAPPPPRWGALAAAGIVDEDRVGGELQRSIDDLAARRRLLRGYVEHDGGSWDDVSDDEDATTGDPERTR